MGGSVIPRSRWCRGPSERSAASGSGVPAARGHRPAAARSRSRLGVTVTGVSGPSRTAARGEGSRRAAVPFWPRSSSHSIPRPGDRVDPEPDRLRRTARVRRTCSPDPQGVRRSPVIDDRRCRRSGSDASSARISSSMPADPFRRGPAVGARRRSPRGSGWWRAPRHRRRRSVLREAAGPTGSRWRRRRRRTTGRAGSGGVATSARSAAQVRQPYSRARASCAADSVIRSETARILATAAGSRLTAARSSSRACRRS